MRKNMWMWVVGGVVGLIVIGGALYTLLAPKPVIDESARVQVDKAASAGDTKKACEIFTDDVAKKVLGASAKKSTAISSDNQSSTDMIIVSNCGYDAGSTIANILVRGAKKEEAYSTNIFGFDSTRTQGMGNEKVKSISIGGLGDQAYYNPAFKQVNVLVNEGQYWIIVQAGNAQTLAEKLARAVVDKL